MYNYPRFRKVFVSKVAHHRTQPKFHIMYYDDRYHPTTDADEMSVESSSTFTANTQNSVGRRRRRAVADEIKRSDKGYCTYQLKPTAENGFKSSKIEMYDSGSCIGNRIRDPMSGARMAERVGSKQEYKFFKVGIPGLKRDSRVTLFYDSPEHFERHQKSPVSKDIKEKWIQTRCDVLGGM